MATVLDLIKRSMRLNGTTGAGEALTPDQAADGLMALNAMLSLWATEKLMLHKFETVSHTPAAGSFTIGATGNLVTARPVEILSAFRRTDGVDTPIDVIDRERYEAISAKAHTGSVSLIYYKPTAPNGTAFIWPVSTGETLFLTLQQPLTAFATVSDVVSLPDGYEEALAFNLAVHYAPEFGMEATPTVQRKAANSKRRLKVVNSEVAPLQLDAVLTR